ncbi:MAG: TetR family transcriptional regulator [Rhizobiales bacterium]|nr:TetR family transcriptional regulator [Hyphomicrobiales bacterium]
MSQSALHSATSPVIDSKAASAGRGGDTRKRLIDEAERLFGERGINGVTLRDINKAAGQRNESALHYHFGSKQELVQAIMKHRSTIIDARRVQLINEVIAADRQHDLRAVVSAMLMPMVELMEKGEGVNFVRFMAQVLSDPEYNIQALVRRSDLEGILKCSALVEDCMAKLPAAVKKFRGRSMLEQSVLTLAAMARRETLMATPESRRFMASNVIDVLCGFLLAPVSDETKALL